MRETTAKFLGIYLYKVYWHHGRICYRYTSSVQIAHDLAHDAFLKAIEKSETYRGTGAFEGWLRKITINVALEYLREQKKNLKLTDWVRENTKYAEFQENDLMEEKNDHTESELLAVINQLPDHLACIQSVCDR
ncbi:MAG: RNA polymerase sigma factor [Saprospiraceae bacterium]|nr:RNA polymerase sigma factor [Saprospiraceae bacterium]